MSDPRMRTPEGFWGVAIALQRGGALLQPGGCVIVKNEHAYLLVPSSDPEVEGEIVAVVAPGFWVSAQVLKTSNQSVL